MPTSAVLPYPCLVYQPSLVEQVSSDDRRHLCERTKLSSDVGLTPYGSVVYQLKDANMEASGTCDFVWRAMQVFYKTGEENTISRAK